MRGRSPSTLRACRRLKARNRFLLPLMLRQQQPRQQKRSRQTRRQGTLAACTSVARPGAPSQLLMTLCSLLQAYQSCVELETVQVTPELSLFKVSPLHRRPDSGLLPPLTPPPFSAQIIQQVHQQVLQCRTANNRPWSCCGAPAGPTEPLARHLAWPQCGTRAYPHFCYSLGSHALQGRVASHSAAELLRCSGGGDLAASDLVPGQYEGAHGNTACLVMLLHTCSHRCINLPGCTIHSMWYLLEEFM